MATNSSSSHYPMMELLMRYDVSPKIAENIAMNELWGWSIEVVTKIFDQIKKPKRGYCPFHHPTEFIKDRTAMDIRHGSTRKAARDKKSLHLTEYFRTVWPSVFEPTEAWLLAPRHLMRKAADERAALCVNRAGSFSVRKTGYVAVSHAWIEGLQRLDDSIGASRSRIDLIFASLSRQCVEVEWLWLDVLAIPGPATTSTSVEDELLKIDIINILAEIYQNADSIVIFDALTWQLQSNDPFSVATVLACGTWASRLWAFQEIKLAKKAYIITAGPKGVKAPEWSEITNFLTVARTKAPAVFQKLWLFYMVLHDKARLHIRDLVGRCRTRETGNDIDYVRAFFPTLGLKWKLGMTREEGMQEIYHSQRWEATRTLFSYGCPRLSVWPGWMPSTLVGLEVEVTSGFEDESRGIRGVLSVAPISKIEHQFKKHGRWVLNCVVGNVSVQCTLHESEAADVVSHVNQAVSRGDLYVLRPHHVDNNQQQDYFNKVALFAIKASTREVDGFECSILCAVLVVSQTSIPLREQEILIRQGSYVDHGFDFTNQVQYHRYLQNEESANQSGILASESHNIHQAARNNDLEAVKVCVRNGEDSHGFDDRGLSALHIAASRGSDAILSYLLSLPNIDATLACIDSRKNTPLHSAAQYNQPSTISLLVQHGVNPDLRREDSYTPLMLASCEGSLEAVQMLLSLKADPNANRQGKLRETSLKLVCGQTDPPLRRLALAKALLDAGADANGIVKPVIDSNHSIDPNQDTAYIWPAISEAIWWSSTELVELLLSRGADPNIPNASPYFSPLKIAIQKIRADVVRKLIDAGGKCNVDLLEGQNLLHLAASCPDYQILQMILETLTDEDIVRMLEAKLDDSGETPISIAEKKGTRVVNKMLHEAYIRSSERMANAREKNI